MSLWVRAMVCGPFRAAEPHGGNFGPPGKVLGHFGPFQIWPFWRYSGPSPVPFAGRNLLLTPASGHCSAIQPNFERLLDRDMLLAYHDKLERFGVGVEGQINKLDAIDAALSFIQLMVLKDKPTHPWHQRALRISESLKAWKATLRKRKTRKRAQRLEDLSATQLSIMELTQVLDCRAMGDDFHDILRRVETGRKVSNGELQRSTAAIAALLMFKSWQRPGAVANMTMREFLHHHLVKEGEDEVVVKRVKEHKTGMSGSAKVVLTSEDFSKVQA